MLLGIVLLVNRRVLLALAVSLIALSFHLYVGLGCLLAVAVGYYAPKRILVYAFGLSTVIFLSGIYVESIYGIPRDYLGDLILTTKGAVTDEYLFEVMETGWWGRLSLWLMTSSFTAYLLFAQTDDKIGSRLLSIGVAANSLALAFSFLLPIIARIHLLGLMLAALVMAGRHVLNRKDVLLMTVMILLYTVSVLSNQVFIDNY